MNYPYKNIVLTGASSGIGRALASELANKGVHFLLIGRNQAMLEQTATEIAEKQATFEILPLDVRDAGLGDAIKYFDDNHPVDLVVANAGIARGLSRDRHIEPLIQSSDQIDINLKVAINTVQTLLAPMRQRKAGQIALVSSLAAIRPSGDLPAYSASKAGLVAWGVALRRTLRGQGITVSVVTPGFVTSPMSAQHRGPQPFRMASDKAAKRIAQGLRKKRARISVPQIAAVLLRLENLLPPMLCDWVERCFAADVIDPKDE